MKKKLRLKTFRKNIIQLVQDIVLFLLYLVLSIVIDIINEKKQG